MRNTADGTGGKPSASWLQYMPGVSAINSLVAFSTSMDKKERRNSWILSRELDETSSNTIKYYW
jgi:hypothetical protein